MKIYKPPAPIEHTSGISSVFLAGSIEMDKAAPWQSQVEAALADLDIIIMNPRREAWDASWRQSIDDDNFRGQVEWELEGLERATWIAVHFDPATKSPITLLELGLFASSGRLIVSCPPGFWRRGNVEVVCARYGVPLLDDLDALIPALRERLGRPPTCGGVRGIDHVQLAMPAGAEAQARAFYGQGLGLRELPKPAGLAGRGGCWFAAGQAQIHLGVEADFRPARKAHPALLAGDLEAAIAHLEGLGIEVRRDEAIAGVRRFFVDDPFGNRVEVIQDAAPRRPHTVS